MRATKRVSRVETDLSRSLWAAGVRGYRRQHRLPGRPDLAFTRLRLAVFLHGCFWHRCPTCRLSYPRANGDFWRAKLDANVERDKRAMASLQDIGWAVEVIWECSFRRDRSRVVRELAAVVRHRREELERRIAWTA